MAERYEETLATLVEAVCRKVGDWVGGTATGGSATTCVDTVDRLEVNDYWNDRGSWIYMRSGASYGKYRKVTNFDSGTSTITFGTMTTSVASGDLYSLHTEFHRHDVVAAINDAIRIVYDESMVWRYDEDSITLVSDVYEYAIPSGFLYITRLTMADSGGSFDDMSYISSDEYHIVKGSAPKIKFIQMPVRLQTTDHYYGELFANADLTGGRKVRLEGLARPALLDEDSDVCQVNPAFVVFQAAALLHMSKIRRPANEPDDHRTQYELCQKRADVERSRTTQVQIPMNAKKVV